MKINYSIIGIIMLAFLLLPAMQVSAQEEEVYSFDFPHPCTGVMTTISGTLFYINDQPYARYTYFGHTREFRMDSGFMDAVTQWFESIASQEIENCDFGFGGSYHSNPVASPAMNSSVQSLQNELFMLDFFQPRSSETRSDHDEDQAVSEEGAQLYRQFSATSDISSYNADGYTGSASAYGLSYIGLFTIRSWQLGANLNGLRFVNSDIDAADAYTQTLWGISFKQSTFDDALQRSESKQFNVSMMPSEFSDFGMAISGMRTFRTRNDDGGMVNRGIAYNSSLQVYNDGDFLDFDMGLVYGTLRSKYLTDRLAGSINALFLVNLTVHEEITMEGMDYTAVMSGARFGGSLFYNVFQGAGFQVSLSYTPKTYVYMKAYDVGSGASFTESGFNGASSFSFNSGFSYRF